MNRRVDQKLHLASLALAAIKASPAAETALAEAALFHLHVAYRAYLYEILEHSKIATVPHSAQQAAELLRAHRQHNADIDELVLLEQSGAWPAQLLAAYAAASIATVPQLAANASLVANKKPVANKIALCDVTAQSDGEPCAFWMREFHTLLQRQRAHAQEW